MPIIDERLDHLGYLIPRRPSLASLFARFYPRRRKIRMLVSAPIGILTMIQPMIKGRSDPDGGDWRQRRFVGCAASTAVDFDGNAFTIEALTQLQNSILEVPVLAEGEPGIRAIFGKVVGSHIEEDENGENDLMVTLQPIVNSQTAERLWRRATDGVPIGLGLDVLVTQSESRPGGGVSVKAAEILGVLIVAQPLVDAEVIAAKLASTAARDNLLALSDVDRKVIVTAPTSGEFPVTAIERTAAGLVEIKYDDVAAS